MKKSCRLALSVALLLINLCLACARADGTAIELPPYRDVQDSRIGCLQFGAYQPEWMAWESMIRPMGLKRIRFSACVGDWNSVDWARSDYAMSDAYVAKLRTLAQNGVKITYVLTFWDTDHHRDGIWGTQQNRFKAEEDIARYLDYVRYVATRCKGIVLNYEFFNEPSRTDSPIQYIEPADYVNLVRRAASVIREADPAAKLVIGATSDLFDPAAEQWLFDIMQPDILPMVDGISWHGMGEASPQYPYYQGYLKRYAELVDRIKVYARERGFQGVFISDEMRWGTPQNHNADKMEFMYTEITSAKYFAREIIRHLGMDVVTGFAMDLNDPAQTNFQTIRYLCAVMGGAQCAPMPLQVRCASQKLQMYSFKMQNGDLLLALWRDEAAVDTCIPVPADITVSGVRCEGAQLIDVVQGTQEPFPCLGEGNSTLLEAVPVYDYPMLIRLSGVDDAAFAALQAEPGTLAALYQRSVLLNGGRDVLLGLYGSFPGSEALREPIAQCVSLLMDTQAEPVSVTVAGDASTPWETRVLSTLTGDYLVVLAGMAGEAATVTLAGVKGKAAQLLGADGTWTKTPLHNTKQGAQCAVTLTGSYAVLKIAPKNPQTRVAAFRDAKVEAAVRAALGKPEGLISLEEAATVTQLDIAEQGVTSLEGLQALVNLTYLNAPMNRIRDLAPLSGLAQLTHLELWNNNIKDLSPLATLANLRILWIGSNPIADLSPIAALTQLTRLGIWGCKIKNLDVLRNLPNLTELDARYNPVQNTDILDELQGVQIAAE